MRSFLSLVLTLLLFIVVTSAQEKTTRSAAPLVVADQYYWSGPEGNIGLSITGKFQSLDKMAETFNLLQEIGVFKISASKQAKSWKLHEILILVDFNGNGNVATWRVSGPKPLVLQYLEKMKRGAEDRSVFYDFSYTEVNFKPTAYWEREK